MPRPYLKVTALTLKNSKIMKVTIDGKALRKNMWMDIFRHAIAAAEARKKLTLTNLAHITGREVFRSVSAEDEGRYLEIVCGGKPAFVPRDPVHPDEVWRSARALLDKLQIPYEVEIRLAGNTPAPRVLRKADRDPASQPSVVEGVREASGT